MRNKLLPTAKHVGKHWLLVRVVAEYGSNWEEHLNRAFEIDPQIINFALDNPYKTSEYIRLLKSDVKNLRGEK